MVTREFAGYFYMVLTKTSEVKSNFALEIRESLCVKPEITADGERGEDLKNKTFRLGVRTFKAAA